MFSVQVAILPKPINFDEIVQELPNEPTLTPSYTTKTVDYKYIHKRISFFTKKYNKFPAWIKVSQMMFAEMTHGGFIDKTHLYGIPLIIKPNVNHWSGITLHN